MKILPVKFYTPKINSKNEHRQSFGARGQALNLKLLVEKHSSLIPPRVLEEAKKLLAKDPNSKISLKQIHLDIYAPLMQCKTLEEAKKLFPEFEVLKDAVIYRRKSKYRKDFETRTNENFSLKMLQDFWYKLETKETIAEKLGMKSRSSLEWPLKQIRFREAPSWCTLFFPAFPENLFVPPLQTARPFA